MKILFVTPGTEPDGAATQLSLLARRLPRSRFEGQVCTLGPEGHLATTLRAEGVAVASLGWSRWLDPLPLWRLRRLVRDFQPDVIHAIRLPALRALALAVGRPERRLVVSRPLPSSGKALGRIDRWLLGRADRIIVRGPAEADRCLAAGLPAAKLVLIPPGVEPPSPMSATLEPGRAVVCAGRLEAHKGYRDAVWAFDVLRYLYDDLRLLLVGDGPERCPLQRFVGRIRATGRVEFAGTRSDASALMASAEMVWVPSLADGGVGSALEAMAAGRPVVASRLPALAEVVLDGETGLLVPPGDKIELARQTRRLLNDPALARQLGESGRERAACAFAPEAAAERTAEVYESLAA
ncbi:MAG: glycosyltransferase [Gemmataceae bacterium]|nr:glycosyltransferase [Gemmataceae bacterium]